jgi:prepilin-type N-terminal cleavage/methylation domain-containing protein
MRIAEGNNTTSQPLVLTLNSEPRTPNSRGFTLIELAMVIIVLGVMISLVIPTFGEITGSDLRRSARHLTGMIRFLRDESEATKTVYRLRFDVSGGHYWAEALTVTSERTAEFKRMASAMAAD